MAFYKLSIDENKGTVLATLNMCDTNTMHIRTTTLLVSVVILGFSVFVLAHIVFYKGNFYRTQQTHMSDRNSLSFINGIYFEIASTTSARMQGLSGRSIIPYNYAMLFIFATDSRYGFWMKDMRVPIDIVWLSDTGHVVGIDHSVQPNTYPRVFYPSQPVKYVLEMRAGSALQRGWKDGTTVNIPLPSSKNVLN